MDSLVALVGIGANLGDPRARVLGAMDAVAALAGPGTHVRRSGLWASRPVDCPPGSPDFVNAVLALEPPPGLDAPALLDALQALEAEAGRIRGVRNAPRTLDLDLLLFGDLCLESARLRLPHPRGHERAFVLLPASEVAPGLVWPGTGRCIGELAAQFAGGDDVHRLEDVRAG
jgi:2-amino-4-hydroxy-6-hydroxymethyldihydropteridine diphosphokinase